VPCISNFSTSDAYSCIKPRAVAIKVVRMEADVSGNKVVS
jgi:hypothetical protein